MSIVIQRNIDKGSFNVDLLVKEIIDGVAKYISIPGYDGSVMDIEVEDTWGSADDTELDGVISAHDPQATDPDEEPVASIHPYSVNFGGNLKGWIEREGSSLKEYGGFVYPGTNITGIHTKAIIMATGFGPGYYRVRVRDITNGYAVIFNIQKVRDANDEWETVEVVLPAMPTEPSMLSVELASAGAGTTAYLTSILFC